MQTYNGWSNYPTWTVHLWLDNDQYTQRECERIVKSSDYPANGIKTFVEEDLTTMPGGMEGDLLGYALGLVNWHEIAAAYTDNDGGE